MGNAHAGRNGRGNRRGRRGPPRPAGSQPQNGAIPIRQTPPPPSVSPQPAAEAAPPSAPTSEANGYHTEPTPAQPVQPETESQPRSDAPAGQDAAPFIVTPTSERASPYRFVGERRMLPRDTQRHRPHNGHEPNGAGGVSVPEPRAAHPHVTGAPATAPNEETNRHPRGSSDQLAAREPESREDAATPDDDESDEAWTTLPRRDVRGDVGPLIDALHEVFVQDRAISSQGGSTRCGICYLHFAYSELEYRDPEGYYVCPNCKRALGPARLPMVRKQRRG